MGRHDTQHNGTQHNNKKCDTQHNDTHRNGTRYCKAGGRLKLTVAYAECRYAECRYAECRYAECRGPPSWYCMDALKMVYKTGPGRVRCVILFFKLVKKTEKYF
jgi:hypothetical protein